MAVIYYLPLFVAAAFTLSETASRRRVRAEVLYAL